MSGAGPLGQRAGTVGSYSVGPYKLKTQKGEGVAMTQHEMMAIVEESWRTLDEAVAGLTVDDMTEPDVVGAWSITDVLGHVTAWDSLAVEYLERWRRGEAPPPRDWDSADVYNAREAARRQGWTLARVTDEAADIRRRLRAQLAGITDEEWETVMTINDPERLADWVGGALNGADGPGTHAAEHAAAIRAWRAAHGRPSSTIGV